MMMRQFVFHNEVFKDGHKDRYTRNQLYLREQQERDHDVGLVGAVGKSSFDKGYTKSETFLATADGGCYPCSNIHRRTTY